MSGRLKPKLIENAPTVIDPDSNLKIILRDLQIHYIENLEYLNPEISVVDLTNNDITELVDTPLSVHTLLLGNNDVKTISTTKSSHVKSLLLVNNSIASFRELSKLRLFSGLEHLLLLGNPVADETYYRSFTVWLLPTLTDLDCERVTAKERSAAVEMFGESFDERTPVADALFQGTKEVKTEPKDVRLMQKTLKSLTAEERAHLVAELEKATSMEDIERISQALKTGYIEE